MTVKPVIGVVFYSTFGHVAALAEEVIKGAEAAGAIVKPYVIQETLSETILGKMHAGSSLKPKYPVITPNDLKELDGFLLGAPTRYGRLPAQVDAFFDQTGGLWATGALVGKFVSSFTSTAGQHSGQESTAITTFPFFAHHGLAYVPIGYTDPSVGNVDQVQGGSPYGASAIAAADGHLQPTANDLKVAAHQGSYFATFVGTFVKGKNAIAASSEPAPIAAGTTSTEPASEAPATKEGESSAAPAAAATGAAGTAAVASKTGESSAPVTDSTAAPTTGDKAVAAEPKPANGTAETEPATGAAATTADKPAESKPAAAAKPASKKKSGGFLGGAVKESLASAQDRAGQPDLTHFWEYDSSDNSSNSDSPSVPIEAGRLALVDAREAGQGIFIPISHDSASINLPVDLPPWASLLQKHLPAIAEAVRPKFEDGLTKAGRKHSKAQRWKQIQRVVKGHAWAWSGMLDEKIRVCSDQVIKTNIRSPVPTYLYGDPPDP